MQKMTADSAMRFACTFRRVSCRVRTEKQIPTPLQTFWPAVVFTIAMIEVLSIIPALMAILQ